MRKIMLLVLVMAAVATGGGIAFLQSTKAGSSLDAAATSQEIVQEISRCVADRWDPQTMNDPITRECIVENVLRGQVANGNVTNMNLALADIVQEHREFWGPCHDIMHSAADHGAKTPTQVLDLIRKIDLPSCQGGLVHGLLDAFAKLSPSQEDFIALGAACSEYYKNSGSSNDSKVQSNMSMLYAYCTDGAGHAAWESTQDLRSAIDACNALNEAPGRASCAEGVLMQIFEPANGTPVHSVEESFTIIPEMCATWPDNTPTRDTLVGCNTGAAYIYTRPAWHLHSYFAGQVGTSEPTEIPSDVSAKMQEHIDKAIDLCIKYHTSACLKSIGHQLPTSLFADQAATKRLCGRLGEFETYCLEDQAQRKTRL
jgi:hypothetical protein